MLILLPLVVGLCLHTLPQRAEAEVSGSTQLDLRNPKSTSTAQSQPASTFHLPSRSSSPSQLLRQFHPANCTVGNTTYAHGQTFKLDCKTQCVCENGRHACSSLCPKEQLPAPEDTISCRSPRLVEVPGHCCKMWLCENPTADVTATCRNSSTSPWTPCSRRCGIGLSTRVTSTTRGCHELSNVRLCENRACDRVAGTRARGEPSGFGQQQQQQLNQVDDRHGVEDVESNVLTQDGVDGRRNQAVAEHRIRKGHECRHIQRLGPARIRLGPCVSRKLYRPKLCGRCQRSSKCCVPSVSTTIQVELLCPLQANDPISYVQQGPRHHQQQQQEQWLTEGGKEGEGGEREQHLEEQHLWDTVSLEPIDQEFLQSHQQQIENKFIAVEWILKCECSRNAYCGNSDDDNNNNNNPHAYHNYNNNSNYNNNNINGYTMDNNYNNNGNDKENNKNNKNKIRDKRPQNALSFGAAGRATAAEAEQEEESTNGISVESNYYGISGSGSDNNNNNNINNYHRNHYNDKNNNYNYNYQPNNDNDENNNNNYHFASNEQRKQLQREQQQEHQYKQQLEKQKQHQQHQRKHKQKQHRQQHAYLPRT